MHIDYFGGLKIVFPVKSFRILGLNKFVYIWFPHSRTPLQIHHFNRPNFLFAK